MTYRYQAKILDHSVSIKKNPLEQYEVFIFGPTVLAKHYWTFLTVEDANDRCADGAEAGNTDPKGTCHEQQLLENLGLLLRPPGFHVHANRNPGHRHRHEFLR